MNGNVSTVQSLECFYDEVDDRLMYHLNQGIKCDHASVAHVLTGDTDIFINLMYNYVSGRNMGSKKFGFIT